MKKILFSLMIIIGIFRGLAVADEPNPLALPCTVGAKVCAANPYYPAQKNWYTCYSCADQTCWSIGEKCNSNPATSQTFLESNITEYYNNRGEWAGIFKLGNIEKMRVEMMSDTEWVVHVRYFYIPIPGNSKGRTDSGYDQRFFVFNKKDGDWVVVSMGGYMSAKL